MNSLEQKMLRARETSIPIGNIFLTVRRPTDLQATRMRYTDLHDTVLGVADHVIGWKGVVEMDLAPGGTDAEAPFSKAVFKLWLEDNPEVWQPLIKEVLGLVKRHTQKVEESGKN